ncbi:MAG TPA: hypothetical protein VFE54_14500 [Mucilaginibacter sp.]|jgi:hypothetical protein|nr:hypothetical protein [Mucilaginibacter sp.]
MKRILITLGILSIGYAMAFGQKPIRYKLDKMFTNGELEANPGHNVIAFSDGKMKGVTFTGIIWIKGLEFGEGTIETDLRGRNEFLKSFVGIVFNTADTSTYEDILFRPFNFRHQDPVRRTWSLAYTSEPDFPYTKLRKESTGQFESEILPNPVPEEWIHARIAITKDSVQVFVNHMEKPSLTVKRLGNYHGKQVGLLVFGNDTPGDFANLVITPAK